jgi:hypothetical protein
MDDLNEKFNELLKKAEQNSERKKYLVMLTIEVILQLVGMSIIITQLGWLIGIGLLLLFTGSNLQNKRTDE